MGYYVTLEDADYTIPTKDLDVALERLKALNFRHDLKNGGQYPETGDPFEDKWFSWMPPRYHETAQSAAEVFEMLGFTVETDEEGLHLTGYDGKTGDEDTFLEAVADLVKPDSYLEWQGEEGHRWRLEYDGKTSTYRSARVVWD
jgi:hypothetical protein